MGLLLSYLYSIFSSFILVLITQWLCRCDLVPRRMYSSPPSRQCFRLQLNFLTTCQKGFSSSFTWYLLLKFHLKNLSLVLRRSIRLMIQRSSTYPQNCAAWDQKVTNFLPTTHPIQSAFSCDWEQQFNLGGDRGIQYLYLSVLTWHCQLRLLVVMVELWHQYLYTGIKTETDHSFQGDTEQSPNGHTLHTVNLHWIYATHWRQKGSILQC